MNAHSHTDFGSFIPQGGDPSVGPNYEIELIKPLGDLAAGDALIFDVEKEPDAGDIVALRRACCPGVEIGTLLTDLPKGRWELLRTFGNVGEDEDGSFMFRAMTDNIVRFPKVSEFVGIDACTDARVWPQCDTPAPKPGKPTPPRDAKGRFLKSDTLSGRFKLEIVESFYEDGALRCLAQSIGEPPRAHIPFWFGFSLEGEGAEAGQRDFAGLRHAIGVLGPTDSSEIHFKPFVADVNFVDGDYRLSNFEGADAKPDADDENEEWRERGLRDRLNMEGPAFELEFLWALLEPYIEDQLGDRKGPYDFVLDGKELPVRAESLRVIGAKEAEVMHFHLVRLGMQIDALTKANTGRA